MPTSSANPLRIAFFGAGRIATKHLAAFTRFPDRLHLAAICDPNPAATVPIAEQFHLAPSQVFTDPARLLRDIPLDAVAICTPHDTHHPLARAAIDRGLHVMLEKPMAITMHQCRDLVDAADAAGVALMAAHNHRFKANYRALMKAIAAGELGRIRMMRAEAHLNILPFAPPEHWVYDARRAGGGVAIALGLHRIDLFRYFVGEIVRVTAATCRTFEPRFTHGAEDYALATFDFTPEAGGGVAEFFATYSPSPAPWGESFVIYGEKGTAHAMPLAVKSTDPVLIASPARSTPQSPFVPLPPDPTDLPTGDMFIDEYLHFADSIRAGLEPLASARFILGTMQAVFALYESAKRKAPVELAEI